LSFRDKKVVLSLCRLAPEKAIDVFIDAAALIIKKRSDFIFLVIGDGPSRKGLEERARRFNIDGAVIFKGTVAEEEVPVYYRSADIFVVTQFPPDQVLITITDAMASGVPVIATSPLGELEILGDAGALVPPGEPEVLAQKIIEVADNNELRRACRQKGIERAIKLYQWPVLMEKCATVYEQFKKT